MTGDRHDPGTFRKRLLRHRECMTHLHGCRPPRRSRDRRLAKGDRSTSARLAKDCSQQAADFEALRPCVAGLQGRLPSR